MKHLDRILQLLQTYGHTSVRQLADELGVSTMTVYRHLKMLEKQRVIIRTVGGAMLWNGYEVGTAWHMRRQQELTIKQHIGTYLASVVSTCRATIFDIGTTAQEVARALPKETHLTAITCSIPTALLLGTKPFIELLVPAGRYRSEYGAVTGPLTESFLRQLKAEVFIMAADAVDIDLGVSSRSWEVVALRQVMMTCAQRVILACDYTKFGRSAPFKVTSLKSVTAIVTDSRMPEDMQKRIRAMGIELTLVPVASGEKTVCSNSW